jgi:ubiquinone/menaquinone biosynthesis C-methylase UbiE
MAGVQPERVQKVQADWLKDWHRYLLNTFCEDCRTALEIGCGSGYVMSNLKDLIRSKGVDIDMDQVKNARERGLDVLHDDVHALRFNDRSFDLVYCSFALMWFREPERALKEMVRVSRKRVLILNEPVWNSAVYHPPELSNLIEAQKRDISGSKGELDMGLKMLDILKKMKIRYRFGTVPINSSPTEMRKWVDFERRNLERSGIILERVEPAFYHIPFIWVVADTSGR